MSPSSDRVVEALGLLHRYVDAQPGMPQAPSISIAISRQAGSRGADISQAVGTRLGWPVFDHELLTRIAEAKGINARLLEKLDERCPNWLQDLVAGFSLHYTSTEWTYMKQLVQLMVSLGEAGHCVIVGRGAGHVLPPETTVRVRVVAPHVVRIANTEKRTGMSWAAAERWVDQTDADRFRFVKNHFNRDPNDPLNYDLILNSGRYSVEDCAALIIQATRMREAHVMEALTRARAPREVLA